MNSSLPVSPEYDGSGHAAGESMRTAIERKVYREGAGPYLLGAYKTARATDAFDDVHLVKDAIDRSHGYRDLTGRLFLDGGVLAIDWLTAYAPAIVPRLHGELDAFEHSQTAEYLDGYASAEDELAYVDALRHWGDEARIAFSMDYSRVIADVAAFRGFSVQDPYRQLVITQGAGYVLKAAEEAFKTDLKAFDKEVTSTLIPQGQARLAVADALIQEAIAWHKKEPDQAA